jgi:hypothetical protein
MKKNIFYYKNSRGDDGSYDVMVMFIISVILIILLIIVIRMIVTITIK